MTSTLQLFPEPNLQGQSETLHKDSPDLSAIHFLKRARSLTVIGDPWIVFSDNGYKGEFKLYKEGNYKLLSSWDNKICSVRVVKGGLKDPTITLYDEINYAGNSIILQAPVQSLHDIHINPSSYKVTRGAWILYTTEDYQDDNVVTLAKDEIKDISQTPWNFQVRSLKPI